MKTYLISYDLVDKSFYDYERLIKYIKEYSYWAKPLESTWLIKTDKIVSTVRDELKRNVSGNDKIFVIEVTGANWASFNLSSNVTDWLKNNL